jgi:DUF4097 and DUF4098 domain-containing protein YvlB
MEQAKKQGVYMRTNFKKAAVIMMIAGSFLLLTAVTSFAKHEKSIKKSFDVTPEGLLTIDSDRGSVLISVSENNRIDVEIILKVRRGSSEKAEGIFEDFDIEFEPEGNDLTIYAEYKGRRSFWGDDHNRLNVEFLVTVPKKYNLDIKTGGGSITIEDLNGESDVSTSGGSLSFKNVIGEIKGRTSGGSVNILRCEGFIDVKTSGGSINITRVKGEVNARTSGGSINIDEIMGMIDASTSGGSVSARIIGQPKDDCRLTTSGGSVNVYLDKNVNLYVDAKTSNGYVDTDFPITVRGKLKKSKLQGKINDGGPELYLRTSGGNIYLNEI